MYSNNFNTFNYIQLELYHDWVQLLADDGVEGVPGGGPVLFHGGYQGFLTHIVHALKGQFIDFQEAKLKLVIGKASHIWNVFHQPL